MRVDTHVSCSTREGLSLPIRNVLFRLGITILLCHAKINDMDNVGTLGAWSADEEVVGFDVSVDEVLFVDGLYPREHLFGNHNYCLDRELAVAVVEQVFQTWTKQVYDQYVMETFLAEVVDIGDPGATDEDLVCPVFVTQLRSIALARFEFDGNLLVVQEVGALEDDTERTLANLLSHPVVDAHDVAAGGGHGDDERSLGGGRVEEVTGEVESARIR